MRTKQETINEAFWTRYPGIVTGCVEIEERRLARADKLASIVHYYDSKYLSEKDLRRELRDMERAIKEIKRRTKGMGSTSNQEGIIDAIKWFLNDDAVRVVP